MRVFFPESQKGSPIFYHNPLSQDKEQSPGESFFFNFVNHRPNFSPARHYASKILKNQDISLRSISVMFSKACLSWWKIDAGARVTMSRWKTFCWNAMVSSFRIPFQRSPHTFTHIYAHLQTYTSNSDTIKDDILVHWVAVYCAFCQNAIEG